MRCMRLMLLRADYFLTDAAAASVTPDFASMHAMPTP